MKQQLFVDKPEEHLCEVTMAVLDNLLDGVQYRVKSTPPMVSGLLGALLGRSMPTQKEVDQKCSEMLYAVCVGCDSKYLKAEVEKDYGKTLHATLHGIDSFCEVREEE